MALRVTPLNVASNVFFRFSGAATSYANRARSAAVAGPPKSGRATAHVSGPARLRTNAEAFASAPLATVTDAVAAAPTANPDGGVTASVYVPGSTSAKV